MNYVLSYKEQLFDMLINYYEDEKASLTLVTLHSKSKFKVDFSFVDIRGMDL